jgi:hypothetical protein
MGNLNNLTRHFVGGQLLKSVTPGLNFPNIPCFGDGDATTLGGWRSRAFSSIGVVESLMPRFHFLAVSNHCGRATHFVKRGWPIIAW